MTLFRRRIDRVEAERRLSVLELNRPRYDMPVDNRVDDLHLRLRETAAWCTSKLDLTAVGSCLRARSIAPHFLAGNQWDVVGALTRARRQELFGVDVCADNREVSRGRLLIYCPDEQLADGAAEVQTREFFDVHNAPPWGTWVGYFEDPIDHKVPRAYVLAWIPDALVSLVTGGIDVNPEGCIAWLDDTEVAIRPVIDFIVRG